MTGSIQKLLRTYTYVHAVRCRATLMRGVALWQTLTDNGKCYRHIEVSGARKETTVKPYDVAGNRASLEPWGSCRGAQEDSISGG
ncbi:Uncharacterized protein HZ326_20917 [Fusarium oxysporum f. sp. albedinis]|nr:Uncharacterized protein HZ326_20917 [Fusarium oxysporum f. sp. albedinis]